MTRQRVAIAAFVGLALAAIGALILVPAWDLAAPGRILNWHVRQPAFVEGALEALAVYALVLAGFAMRARGAGAWLAAITIALYLRRHHVDAPALAAFVYFEAQFAAGALALRAARANERHLDDIRVRFLAGTCVFALGLLASSLLGYGRPADLLVVATAASLVVLLTARATPVTLQLLRHIRSLRAGDLALAAGLLVWAVVLLARSNQTTGYDALWYGFRPEHVLAPARSLFDETGLLAPVFYFPKLYELLLMPLSAASDFSFPLAYGVLLLSFGAWVAYDASRRFGADARLALCAAALWMTLPAIANHALAPKPDLFAGLLVVLTAMCLHLALRGRDAGTLCYGVAAGALAIQAKLVAIPYVGVLLLATCALLALDARRSHDRDARWLRPDRAALGALAAALVITAVLTTRTLMLAGVPTIGPDALLDVWLALGFALEEPIGTLDWTRAQDGDVMRLTADMLLFPSRLEHIMITWIGNAWLWLAGFGLLAAWLLQRRVALDGTGIALVAPVLAIGMTLALGVAYKYRGGDGNYLIAPLALGTILTAACVSRVLEGHRALGRTALAGCVAAALLHMLFSFANASWAMPGTRTFDLDLARSPIDTRHLRRRELIESGLAEFENWLQRTGPRPLRVVGYAQREDHAYWLSARYEALGHAHYMRSEYVDDAAGFARFLEAAQIDVVLLPELFDPGAHSAAVFA
ncbi:MAG TPA: hypothetical protein VND91_11415, partial [Candidatus Saccharimonadia bacterium]|nr:hypothetical protein [Candidatus Saccharimonadia bacterium]